MPDSENSQSRKKLLALAIARGTSIAAWAHKNNVPKQMANRWASEPRVRATAESCRRRALDRAVDRMTRHVAWAADQIAELATDADSQSVQLAALRAIFSNMMAVSEFAALEARMTQIEEQLRGQDGSSARTG